MNTLFNKKCVYDPGEGSGMSSDGSDADYGGWDHPDSSSYEGADPD